MSGERLTGGERRALLSVSNKAGLVEFAAALQARGFELVSTGGTKAALKGAGLEVMAVDELTGFPEIMGGRVKTLHPRVHGGLLGRWDDASDVAAAAANGISPIELLVVNLYPFRETLQRPDVTDELAIENIDIGGPAMVRAAAKNHAFTAVVVEPSDYASVIAALDAGGLDLAFRRALATKAFAHTAAYDAAVAAYLSGEVLPATLTLAARRVQGLRYGENPHQDAAFYAVDAPNDAPSLARAEQLGGKELSYNNLLDLDAALGLALDLRGRGAVVVKHTNPCGVAEGPEDEPLSTVYARARAVDATSAFGGIVAFNSKVDLETALLMGETFLEAIIAPGFDDAALEHLTKKKNLRVMRLSPWPKSQVQLDVRSVFGGFLAQTRDAAPDDLGTARLVTRRAPDAEELRALDLAWRVCRHVKSNAIVYARPDAIVGVGAGQTSRLDSARFAAEKARALGHELAGTVVASDAFFPFADGLEACVSAGATAIAQPGGSVRDDEVIAAADRLGVAMLFTGRRHFRH